MAVLQIMSDLHLEFLPPSALDRWLAALDPSGVDVLILAGDICSERLLSKVLPAFCDVYPAVAYVCGNHEFYKSDPDSVSGTLWDLCVEQKNFTWLDNNLAEIAGLTFVGGTLWFPRPRGTAHRKRHQMNDYRIIQDFEPWVYEQNAACEAVLGVLAGQADVVVTHHMPAAKCVSPRYLVGPMAGLNHYFCRDLTDKIKEWQPSLWVCGHTHDRFHLDIGETKLVCNPLGYPHEPESEARGAYARRCLVEVVPGKQGARFAEGRPGGDRSEI